MDKGRNQRFGRYEVLAELGRGAMGVVYKARDPKINRVVAVKTINLSGQPPEEELEYRERFLREAEAAGRLSHPGIVTIFDVGEEPETRAPYIVMEFVGGQSLEKLLAGLPGHKLPPETALQLTHELAEALDCAHAQGVVHRDLKPANILITEQGAAKIADFGVAKLNLANATLAGRTLGTPAYMSPEQLNGEPVDGRSDLFSLGVILYTVLTGYRPFQGNSAMTVSYKVVNRQPIPATVLDTGLPPALDSIISRAMAKDPADRYQRGAEMVLDLQALREGREPGTQAVQTASAAAILPTATPTSRVPSTDVDAGASAKVLEKLRHNSAAGALLLLGLVIFGARIGHLVWPQPRPVQAQPVATTAQPPTATTPIPSVKTSVKPIVNKPRKRALVAARSPSPKTIVRSAPTPADPPPASDPPVAIAPAMLEIEVDHKFAQASLSIWVDDRLAFTRQLEGTDKKRLVVFHHIQGHEVHAVQVAPGKHLLRVEITSGQITSGAANPSQSATVSGDFVTGGEQILRIQFNKSGEMNLTLQ